MNIVQLRNRLEADGFGPATFHIGDGWSGRSDVMCLADVGYGFEIFYVERGAKDMVVRTFAEESMACEAYLDLMLKQRAETRR